MRQGKFGHLYVEGYSITVYCMPCDRRVEVDLCRVNPDKSKATWRCGICGRPGSASVGAPYTSMSQSHLDPVVIAEKAKRKEKLRALWPDAKTIDEEKYPRR